MSEPGATFADVAPLVRGVRGRECSRPATWTPGLVWAGQVQGLIHDIPTCRELIERIVGEAEAIIHKRLAGFTRPALAHAAA